MLGYILDAIYGRDKMPLSNGEGSARMSPEGFSFKDDLDWAGVQAEEAYLRGKMGLSDIMDTLSGRVQDTFGASPSELIASPWEGLNTASKTMPLMIGMAAPRKKEMGSVLPWIGGTIATGGALAALLEKLTGGSFARSSTLYRGR